MRVKKFITFWLMVCMLSTMAMTVFAADELTNLNGHGSIHVVIRDTESKNAVSGGSLLIYQVASVKSDDGNYTFEYTDTFSGCTEVLEDIQSEDLAADLARYAENHKLKGISVQVGSDGTASCFNLEIGLYLVVQEAAADDYSVINPFLVTIPMKDGDRLIYDVDAAPKVGTVTKIEQPNPTPVPNKPTGTVLPQTGQLWWPVVILAIAGMFFVVCGWVKRRNAEN